MPCLLLAINMYVHIFWLPLLIALSVFAGMLFRTAQLKKSRKQVFSLENEMLNNHAEILKLQKKLSSQTLPPDVAAPVVPLKESPEEKKDKPDAPHKKVN